MYNKPITLVISLHNFPLSPTITKGAACSAAGNSRDVRGKVQRNVSEWIYSCRHTPEEEEEEDEERRRRRRMRRGGGGEG